MGTGCWQSVVTAGPISAARAPLPFHLAVPRQGPETWSGGSGHRGHRGPWPHRPWWGPLGRAGIRLSCHRFIQGGHLFIQGVGHGSALHPEQDSIPVISKSVRAPRTAYLLRGFLQRAEPVQDPGHSVQPLPSLGTPSSGCAQAGSSPFDAEPLPSLCPTA